MDDSTISVLIAIFIPKTIIKEIANCLGFILVTIKAINAEAKTNTVPALLPSVANAKAINKIKKIAFSLFGYR